MLVESSSIILLLKSTPVPDDGRIVKDRPSFFLGEEQEAIIKSNIDGMKRFLTKNFYATESKYKK